MTTNVPGDEFRRLELGRQLRRLADVVFDTPGLTPAIGQAPWVEFHVASETLVNAVAHKIGQFPQHYKGQYFVDFDAVELRARWTYTLAAEPEISDTDPLGLGDGFDRSQTADVDETPAPVVGRRYEPHTGGLTEGGLIDETPAWQPGTGFFEPGRVPGIVGKDAPAKCDCIAYQASHNCADEGCRCGEDFPTSSPCTCSHDFEDHESDGYGTGGPCRGGLVDETPAVPHPSWPTEAELKPWESLIPEADRVAESVKLIDPDSSMEAHYDAEADGYKLAPHVPGCSCQPGSIVIRCRP